MLIRHSQEVLFHQMARLTAESLEASQALVARYRGEQMIAEAVERLDGAEPVKMSPEEAAGVVDKVA